MTYLTWIYFLLDAEIDSGEAKSHLFHIRKVSDFIHGVVTHTTILSSQILDSLVLT